MDHHIASIKGYTYHSAGEWITRLARIGYLTKGILYAVIGILAMQAAFSAGGSTEGTRGAILEIAEQPFGQVLLALIAVGLFGYALWRLVEALIDPEREGSGAEGTIKRVGYFISGLIYLGLSIWAAWIVLGAGSGNTGSGGNSQQAWTAQLMAQPFGQWLVGLIGVIIVGVGLHHFYQAYSARFMQKYRLNQMDVRQRNWARRIGQFGLSARGVTFCIIGAFLIQAALQADPSETRGLAGALQTLAQQPYGPWLLGIVAAGFVAYGIYSISRARYSHFSM